MLTVATSSFPTPLTATRWTLDAQASKVEFRVRQLRGLSAVHGHFGSFDGELELDADGAGRAELRIEAASVETGNRRRDRHLRSPDYFDCERHPLVRFVAAVVTEPRGALGLTGRLEAAGSGIKLYPDITIEGADDRLELAAVAHIDARDLGMSWSPVGSLRTPVALAVRANLSRAA